MTFLEGSDSAVTFRVRRANDYGEAMAPCDSARRAQVARYDRRTFQTPEEHDARFPRSTWLSQGSEHDEWVDGTRRGIRRRFDEDGWVVDVTAAGLVELARIYDELAIHPPEGPAGLPILVLGCER